LRIPSSILPVAAWIIGHSSGIVPATFAAPHPEVTATAPIKNFRLPTFTEEGFRHTLLRADEARIPDPARIDLVEMELTLFTGDADEKIDAMLAAPSATFFPQKLLATGSETVRLERSDLTLTGADWSYDHKVRKVVIKRDARVIFRSSIGDIIK
jgi:hypothetical protein